MLFIYNIGFLSFFLSIVLRISEILINSLNNKNSNCTLIALLNKNDCIFDTYILQQIPFH